MKSSCYIGIDPSLRNFASVALDENMQVLSRLFLSKNPLPKLRGAQRLSFINEAFQQWLKELPTPAVAGIEDYPYGIVHGGRGGSRSVYPLGELGGVVKLALYEANIEIFDYATQTLRKILTGKGNASKKEVMEWAEHFSGEKENEHISFALGAALKVYQECA